MKILYVSNSQIPSHSANSMQVMQMSQAMVKLGHEVLMLGKGNPAAVADDELQATYGLTHEVQVCLSQKSGLRYLLHTLRISRCFLPDVVYARHLSAATVLALLGKRTVLELHDLPRSWREGLYLRIALRSSGLVKLTLISKALLSLVENKFPGSSRVPRTIAPDGVDWQRFSSAKGRKDVRQELAIRISDPVVGYVGSLESGRGIELLVTVAKLTPECLFVIAGGRRDQVDEWRSRVRKEEIDNVRLLGHVAGSYVPDLLAACDILAMPYQIKVGVPGGGETSKVMSPLKMFEYMAAGRAIVSSDLPVLREVLDHNVAVLVHPNDHDAWHRAIINLLDDEYRRETLRRNGRERSRLYSWEVRASICLGVTTDTNSA